jgi:hypothetical protein
LQKYNLLFKPQLLSTKIVYNSTALYAPVFEPNILTGKTTFFLYKKANTCRQLLPGWNPMSIAKNYLFTGIQSPAIYLYSIGLWGRSKACRWRRPLHSCFMKLNHFNFAGIDGAQVVSLPSLFIFLAFGALLATPIA